MKINQIKFYLKRIYHLGLNDKKKINVVWNNLKEYHEKSKWNSGVFEKENYIETVFEIENGILINFYYMIFDNYIHFRSIMFKNFSEELTTEFFILATHFNNILNDGVVIINTNNNYVEYNYKKHIIIPLLFPGEIKSTTIYHYNISYDIYTSFQRIVKENEAPAIIVADLLKKYEKENLKSK